MFSPGVRGADDLLCHSVVDQSLDHLELLHRGARRLEPPLLRYHRQRVARPAPAPGRAVVVRLGEVHQVPQGPGDQIAVAFQKALPFLAGTQDSGDIARNARFFGDDNDGHWGFRSDIVLVVRPLNDKDPPRQHPACRWRVWKSVVFGLVCLLGGHYSWGPCAPSTGR